MQDDVISRQAVIEWLKAKDIIKMSSQEETARKELKALPSVKQEPKAGQWKRISIDKYSEHAMYWYRCDRCGKDNLGNTDWCPNCGAKMIEPQESEDKE